MYVGTWNVNNAEPREGLDIWLVCSEVSPDIYCVCLQEVGSVEQWAVWRAAIVKSLKVTGTYKTVNDHT